MVWVILRNFTALNASYTLTVNRHGKEWILIKCFIIKASAIAHPLKNSFKEKPYTGCTFLS